jgi:hypothetical protein
MPDISNVFVKDPTVKVMELIAACGFTHIPAEKLTEEENVFGEVSVTSADVVSLEKFELVIFGYGLVLSGTLTNDVPPDLVQDSS